MTIVRRDLGRIGGGLLAAVLIPPARAGAVVEIAMTGDARGSRVSFDPVGIRVEAGQIVRWVNRDAGNSHTATAYHPANGGHPRRIPAGADPWDSDYLLPGESFSVTLRAEGVYDYFCVPHEHAGMVGRIVVGNGAAAGWPEAAGREGLDEMVLAAFPPVGAIVEKGRIPARTATAGGG